MTSEGVKVNSAAVNKDYKKGFFPYGVAALMLGLIGGFTAVLAPAFVAELQIDYNNTTWISLALAMSTAACAPILGKLGDVWGRRKTILFGIIIFVIGNVLTALATNMPFMLGARFIVGVGTAAIAPVIMAYIVTEYPPEEMAKGFGLYMLLSCGGVVVGPTCGGLIMQAAGWRTMMWVCVALSVISLFICMAKLEKTEFEKKSLSGFDKAGAFFVLIFFSLLLCIPSFGQNIGWNSKQFMVVLIAGIVALIGLVVVEKKSANPIMNGQFMKRKEFILPVLILFLTQGLMMANMMNVIVFVRQTQPENVIISSFAISIMYIGMSIGAVIIGPMADKKEPKSVLTFAMLFTAAGCAIMMMFKPDSSAGIFMASLGILGIGLGGNATILMKVALSGLAPEIATQSTGTYGLFRDISAPFGVAVFVPLFTNGVTKGVAKGLTENLAASASIRSLAIAELVCIAAGIVFARKLPKIYENKEDK